MKENLIQRVNQVNCILFVSLQDQNPLQVRVILLVSKTGIERDLNDSYAERQPIKIIENTQKRTILFRVNDKSEYKNFREQVRPRAM